LVRRFDVEGEAACTPRSRRPHSSPHAVDLEIEDHIVRLRKELSKKGLDAGAETIAAHLRAAGVDPLPAVSTIWRILLVVEYVELSRFRPVSLAIPIPGQTPASTLTGGYHQQEIS
jgi:hypothetical protein